MSVLANTYSWMLSWFAEDEKEEDSSNSIAIYYHISDGISKKPTRINVNQNDTIKSIIDDKLQKWHPNIKFYDDFVAVCFETPLVMTVTFIIKSFSKYTNKRQPRISITIFLSLF